MATSQAAGKVTIPHLHAMKARGEVITMVAAYDYPSARFADEAGIEIVLVGDFLAMTMLGHPNTLSVTMEEMLIFTRAVSRACTRAMVIGDLPYGSYTVGEEDAVRNALRFMKEAGADAVKLEGGVGVAPVVRRLVRAGIPVMGHIGLTPQSLAVLGGFRVQGRSAAGARQLLQDAHALEDAGAFSVVVEAVPAMVGAALTEALSVPTLGIGAGPQCSGQVLIWHDLFGLYHGHTPKFARRYGEAGRVIAEGLAAYAADVRARRFPTDDYTYGVPEAERAAIERVLAEFQHGGAARSSRDGPARSAPTTVNDTEGSRP
jgi:3-methyl-2-oxobutanoate hydroxymethyltransferase